MTESLKLKQKFIDIHNKRESMIEEILKFIPIEENKYILNSMTIEKNEELLEYLKQHDRDLVKVFKNHNWSNIRKSKKRCICSLKNILKHLGVNIAKVKENMMILDEDGKQIQRNIKEYSFEY